MGTCATPKSQTAALITIASFRYNHAVPADLRSHLRLRDFTCFPKQRKFRRRSELVHTTAGQAISPRLSEPKVLTFPLPQASGARNKYREDLRLARTRRRAAAGTALHAPR